MCNLRAFESFDTYVFLGVHCLPVLHATCPNQNVFQTYLVITFICTTTDSFDILLRSLFSSEGLITVSLNETYNRCSLQWTIEKSWFNSRHGKRFFCRFGANPVSFISWGFRSWGVTRCRWVILDVSKDSWFLHIQGRCLDCLTLAPWSRDYAEKLIDADLVKNFPIFYGTQTFVAVFTTRRVPVLSQQFCRVFFMHLSIIQSARGSSKWSLSLRFTHQNPACISFSSVCVLCPAHFIGLDIVTGKKCLMRRTTHKTPFLRFPPSACNFQCLRPAYFPQQPVLEHPQSPSLL